MLPKTLIMFDVVATLLWLSWEKYVHVQKCSQDHNDEVKLEVVIATLARQGVHADITIHMSKETINNNCSFKWLLI